ncbi:hypothetical protein D3P07_16250 [Paenibacillus sp. 1011MAR3C5]|nr:hypothetical protein D3P07_16250 [Paenibacillus sp. 1011MAR3C5]
MDYYEKIDQKTQVPKGLKVCSHKLELDPKGLSVLRRQSHQILSAGILIILAGVQRGAAPWGPPLEGKVWEGSKSL